MSIIQESAAQTVRNLCDSCTKTGTSFEANGSKFEARYLDRRHSTEVRYGLLDMSQIIGQGLFTVMENGLDGLEWTFQEWVGGKPKSRANGGLGKRDCGIDPTTMDMIRKRKSLRTERIYLHREECALNFIGSVHQDGGLQGTSVYFRSNDNLQTVARSTDFFLDLLMKDMAAISAAIDANSIIGNWGGDNRGGLTKASANNQTQLTYDAYDGVIKQALQQSGAECFASGTVTIPTITADECIFISSCNGHQAYATAEEAVEGLNLTCRDIDGSNPYAAQYDAATGVLTVTSTELGEDIYGSRALLIYVGSAEDGISGCETALPFTETQCKMQWHESPLLFDYAEKPTCDNWFDYWIPKIKTIASKCVELDNTGNGIQFGRQYIAIDPLLLVDRDFANFYHMCKCDNALSQIDEAGRFIPEFIGVQALKGTGLWYWSSTDNLIYLTNSRADELGVIETGYDARCGNIWQKIEILGNAMVIDFNKFATNAKGSPFEAKLTDPYQPENLPHFTHELRADACQVSDCTYDDKAGTYLSACVHVTCPESEGGDYTIFLDDQSRTGSKTITAYEWLLGTPTGDVVIPATDANIETTVPAADIENVIWVTLNVTYDDGTVGTTRILKPEFVRDAC